MDDAEALDETDRARATAAGRVLYWQKQHTLAEISGKLAGGGKRDTDGIRQLIGDLTSDPSLHDADKLAFADLVEELLDSVTGPNASLRDRELAESLGNLWDNLKAIQATYREEVSRIFSQFATRGGTRTREKWDAYVQYLRTLTDRDRILQEWVTCFRPSPPVACAVPAPKSSATTSRPRRSPSLSTTVRIPNTPNRCWPSCGNTASKRHSSNWARTWRRMTPAASSNSELHADVARKVLDAGHLIANHSYSHPVLPKLPDVERQSEIDRTNPLIAKVIGHNTDLFRAPYGARNKEILAQVTEEGMKSVMWNVDSLDWADPIPESIAMRVLHELNQSHRGIVLFHDVHKQGVLALSPIIEELLRQDYTFLAPENGKFVKAELPPAPVRADETPTAAAQPPAASAEKKPGLYRNSWAVIIGINDYEHWPKLRYAVNDANGIEEALVSKFGFKKENIRKLVNGEATRQRIMQVLGDELTDTNKVHRDDRVFFFSPATALHAPSKTAGRWASLCPSTLTRRTTFPRRSACRKFAKRPTSFLPSTFIS